MGDAEARLGFTEQLFDLGDLPDEKQARLEELRKWIDELHHKEDSETLRKAALYDNADLIVIGQTMGTLLGMQVTDERTAIQLACAFYALGKVSRVIGAIADGRAPTADTWYDLHIYGMMGLKAFETGRWS